MVATEFIGYVQSFSACTYVGVEDLADRANFQWNVIILMICMLLVTVRQYFMAPIVCYLPTTVSGSNAESYITNLCWVEGTFPINLTSGIVPHSNKDWDDMLPQQMNYYQWVPLVLGLQAIMYYLPRVFWSIFTYNRTGTDLQNVVRSANLASKDEGEKRDKVVRHIAGTLELMLFNRREYRPIDNSIRRAFSFLPGKRRGNNLIYYYLGVKMLYVLVGIGQLYLMYVFLRLDAHEGYFFFGIRILSDIAGGKPWMDTQIFPRIGMCRQTLQHVAASNKVFAQCVLPINMLNEKIYVFLYFFLSAILIATFVSIPLWLLRIDVGRQRHFVRRFLKMADVYDRDDEKLKSTINRFISEFLRQDGHFILRMLSMNSGDLITVEIVCCLFASYKRKYFGKDFRRGEAPPKANDYGDVQLSEVSASLPPNYQQMSTAAPELSNMMSTDPNFMSVRLQQGGTAVSRSRPLPSAPSQSELVIQQHMYTDSPYVAGPVSVYPQKALEGGISEPDGRRPPTVDKHQAQPMVPSENVPKTYSSNV